jgi:adenylyl-sulfate kinase
VANPPDLVWSASRLTRSDRWGSLRSNGATVWFTGLSGAGKSTLASAVEERLVMSGRPAYRLDGDNVRTGLNRDLGFSREARDENVRRVGEVACLFADSGLVALVSLISPYAEGRRQARVLHEETGLRFVEVYVATPLTVCAERDPKGFYARSSVGDLTSFTGVDDPYEEPESPELVVGHDIPLTDAVEEVLKVLGPGHAAGEFPLL